MHMKVYTWHLNIFMTNILIAYLRSHYREGWNDQFRAQRLPLFDRGRQVCCILSHETW